MQKKKGKPRNEGKAGKGRKAGKAGKEGREGKTGKKGKERKAWRVKAGRQASEEERDGRKAGGSVPMAGSVQTISTPTVWQEKACTPGKALGKGRQGRQ